MAHYPWEKSYPPGVRWELEVPKKTIHQIFEESCAQYGDRPFTDFLDKVMTFRDYKEASDKAAAGFQKLGVNEGLVMIARPPAELDRYFRAEEARWHKLIQDAGIKVE